MRYLSSFWLGKCDDVLTVASRRSSRFLSRLSGALSGITRGVPHVAHELEQSKAKTALKTGTDDLGWLSLTSDSDGPGRHEHDVLCMGVIPDDLDEHDSDGGDLSWFGLIPASPTAHVRQ